MLFVSRRCSLRAVLASACLAHLGGNRFNVSACGQPGDVAAQPRESAAGTLRVAGMRLPLDPPVGWDAFSRVGARISQFVILLDESVAPHTPPWPGQPATALWAYPDLVIQKLDEKDEQQRAMLMLHSLRRRLEIFVNLPMRHVDRAALRSDVRDLGYLE